ncbi:two-component regulator propeller domain-containing protein [Clostridium sp. AL.422]|uniref:sensor histidine kinase n=1 Tax=Clostridium TaxID=1485 RepID=UPI00293DB611|nr:MULTISPECIES: two-component regulator propeller domain-containing protein [unclassified Clostridium]MDV4152067.1 two-component regulator propeller domain-containing protein [Clostridium sp. AL.422]
MKLKLLIFVLIISVLVNTVMPIKVSAETSNYENFESLSIDEGLSNEYVTTIFQDSKGYMWIGTIDGLNRYDGERIKIYNCSKEDSNTLSSTYINDIEEDSMGNIWIATDNGLDILVRDTDTVVRMKDQEVDVYNLGELNITSLLKSTYEDNIMWVGTENGLIKINIESKTVEAFYNDNNGENSLTNSSVTALSEGKYNSIWVGTKDGINIINKNSQIVHKRNQLEKEKLYIYHISKDSLGNMWISTKDNIIVYDLNEDEKDNVWVLYQESVKEYDLEEKTLNEIYTYKTKEEDAYNNSFILNDSNNNTWISSSNGIIRYSNDKQEIDILKRDTSFSDPITSNVITCFYEDFNGTIWIGTDKGVNILNYSNQFRSQEKEFEINNKNIVSMLLHEQYLWVATKYNGIYIYDKTTGNLVDEIYENDKGIDLKDKHIKSLFKLSDEWILVVTNKDIISINTKDNSYNYKLIEDGYYSEITYVYDDGELVWIANTNNLYSYNLETKEKIYHSKNLIDFNINPGAFKYILPDNTDKNILWLGGVETGLVKYHKEKGVIEQYNNNPFDDNSLINDYITCMEFDGSGNLWIGTNIGISKFDIKTNKFTSYTTVDGIINNFINSILFDDNDNLWISTNKGLSKFNIEKEEFRSFTKADGIFGYQFNLNSSIKLDSGMLMFGSTNGCTYFYPDDITFISAKKNKVVIGDIYIGKDIGVYNGKELVLEHDYKDLSVEFFLPNYDSLNNITYEYRLEGIDSEWMYLYSKSNLEFKTLAPGKYTLRIRARNGHGELSEETSMNIRIKNPIWKTPLAYIIYIIIIITIISCIMYKVNILRKLVNIKTMKLNKQLEENKRLSQEIIDKERFKNTYFVNLSHELRTPINVISSTIQLVNSVYKDKCIPYEKASEYMKIINKNCNNLLKIINDIIDSSKIETGHYIINKENNDIVYAVEEAALTMSKFIEDEGLTLIVDPDMEEKIISFDSTEIERVVINLLSNAVKFTPEGGEIRVFIKEIQNHIEITVEDTGIGISKEDQEFIFKRFSQAGKSAIRKTSSSGIGLTLVKHIAELHGGYIRLESEVGKGSRFTIVLPDILERNVV